ncbi:MAG: hypothetical protein IPM06_05750 [Rhizobiales bacterium]|nr:hypothetical protein [Hyphomicrobiales bacterium]
MNSTVTADAKFLRRVLFGLVILTLIAGAMAAFTTVQARNELFPEPCQTACE